MLVLALAACAPRASDPSAISSSKPIATTAPTLVGHRIAAGEGHTCVIRSDDSVWCWGRDSLDQPRDEPPRQVPGLRGATGLFAHDGATCATTTLGLVCWGDNLFGQIAMPPSMEYRKDPELRIGVRREIAKDGALGPQGACVLFADGVDCWGEIGSSIVPGEGTRFGTVPTPEQGTNSISGRRTTLPRHVPGLEGAVQIALGIEHLCALMPDRTVRCMGSDRVGQLGRFERDQDGYFPAATVVGVSDVVQLEAGLAATCARTSRGEVHCWGSDFFGHLGVKDLETLVPHVRFVTIPGDPHDRYSIRPVRVEELPPVTQMSVGATHVCAISGDRRVHCWGSNKAGQLGDGTTERRDLPVTMSGVERAVDVATGKYGPDSHTCVLLDDGKVVCVGRNGGRELGRPGGARELVVGEVVGL